MLVTLLLQTIPLQHETGAQRMTVLQLAIQVAASVFGEISGYAGLGGESFGCFKAAFPVFSLLH